MANTILAPDGHYSPIAGPESIRFCGGLAVLEKQYGIDTSGMTGGDRSKVYEAKDRDGHIWHIRSLGGFLMTAFRDRTEQELIKWNDRNADSLFSSWFSSERLRYCREIGSQVKWLVSELKPERGQSRQARREFKRRIAALMEIQVDLMSWRGTSLAEVRDRLAPFGLPWKRNV